MGKPFETFESQPSSHLEGDAAFVGTRNHDIGGLVTKGHLPGRQVKVYIANFAVEGLELSGGTAAELLVLRHLLGTPIDPDFLRECSSVHEMLMTVATIAGREFALYLHSSYFGQS
mmetsp:Transcript_13951/g.19187  ORF Transcript_13951/g.19187 Transcript_13951/m.19187 type:complete len:116 (-) Transcript_13951:22-369(-)|eukprot:CAMPEP_0196584766 /NCGR_PEP_ID=MMETSP1081-20130531/48406_1 /TAXON_ID=36882 /ORGANISM="Pyramimonas amylifera, Strain CCMP720" /LENGTH=115 /DNA_ID=CAMNT_0041906099 /DNA_START=168 /DNA_END=515 /DNA_ORIENTATION=+